MIYAKKDNKVYRLVEGQEKEYLDDGYDIYDDKGNVKRYSPRRKVEYQELVDLTAKKDAKIAKLEKAIKEKDKKIVDLETAITKNKVPVSETKEPKNE